MKNIKRSIFNKNFDFILIVKIDDPHEIFGNFLINNIPLYLGSKNI